MFKKILLATDGSDHAERALNKAVEMVDPYKTNVHIDLVYCIDGETSKSDILKHGDADVAGLKRKEMFAESIAFLKAKGIRADPIFLHGEPAKTILNHLKQHSYDCVVVGSRGRNELQTLILGSVSHKLAKYVETPLLIVK